MKHCYKCGVESDKQSLCKPCGKEYRKIHHQENKEIAHEHKIIKYAKMRQIIFEAKSVPCMDCGIQYEFHQMDFHHREPSKKKYSISRLRNISSIIKLIEEINKCDVVCSNCHKKRTWTSKAYSPNVVKNRKMLRNLKESNPCTDCNEFYPYYVMEHDHLRDKKATINSLRNTNIKIIQEELKKCELVCSNCHRLRTQSRKNNQM